MILKSLESSLQMSSSISKRQKDEKNEPIRHEFTDADVIHAFKHVFDENEYAKEKLLPKLKEYVCGSKIKNGVDLAVELAFYDAFHGLSPFVVSLFLLKKDDLKSTLYSLLA